MRKVNPPRIRSDSVKAATAAHQNAAMGPLDVPSYLTLPDHCKPFWDAIVTSRARDTWTPADLILAANLARIQYQLQLEEAGTDSHTKLTRLAIAGAKAIYVHPVATVGRAIDVVDATTAEREAREAEDCDLIPRMYIV